MKYPVTAFALLLTIAALMSACATSYQPVPPFTPVDVNAGGHALKTQNVIVILDASSSYGILDEIVAALEARPALKVLVEGHTDSTGARVFNMDLSNRRAKAVVDFLVGKGIAPSRLSAQGYGPDRPIADNATKLGRSKNRRVQFTQMN